MKSIPQSLRSERGSAAPMIIIIILVIVAAAGAAWWFLGRNDATAPAPVAASTPGSTAPGADPAAQAVSPAVEELSIDQLYREARKAMSEQRMVAPAGNNALEYYLAILEKDPTNSGAAEALRELFPFASGTAEQEIIQGNFAEANRIIESLSRADPSNYTLTILRSKLDSRRKQVEQQEAQAAAAAAAPAPPPPPPEPTPAEIAEAQAAAAATAAAAAAAAAPPPPVAAPAPAPTPAPPPPPQGETRDVEVVTPMAPTYPTQAARNREEGWVEVEFTVTAEGVVENARVTASDPQRVFDREAVRSIERTKFTPRLENGVPVSATLRRRIEFKLGG